MDKIKELARLNSPYERGEWQSGYGIFEHGFEVGMEKNIDRYIDKIVGIIESHYPDTRGLSHDDLVKMVKVALLEESSID